MQGLFQGNLRPRLEGEAGPALPSIWSGGWQEKQRPAGGSRPHPLLQKPWWEAHRLLPNSEGMRGPALMLGVGTAGATPPHHGFALGEAAVSKGGQHGVFPGGERWG